jgi:hypothetical protein
VNISVPRTAIARCQVYILFLVNMLARIVWLGRWTGHLVWGNYLDRARPEVTIWVVGYPRLLFLVKAGQENLCIFSFRGFLICVLSVLCNWCDQTYVFATYFINILLPIVLNRCVVCIEFMVLIVKPPEIPTHYAVNDWSLPSLVKGSSPRYQRLVQSLPSLALNSFGTHHGGKGECPWAHYMAPHKVTKLKACRKSPQL